MANIATPTLDAGYQKTAIRGGFQPGLSRVSTSLSNAILVNQPSGGGALPVTTGQIYPR